MSEPMIVKFCFSSDPKTAKAMVGKKYPISIRGRVEGFGDVVSVDAESYIKVEIPEYLREEMVEAMSDLQAEVKIQWETNEIDENIQILFLYELTRAQQDFFVQMLGYDAWMTEQEFIGHVNEIKEHLRMDKLFELLKHIK